VIIIIILKLRHCILSHVCYNIKYVFSLLRKVRHNVVVLAFGVRL